MKKITIFALAAIGFTVNANAQATATANATATIVTPISISSDVDMNFGNLAVTSSAGTVTLNNANGRTKTGGVTFPAVTGTVTSAHFAVTGTAGYTYAITLPSSIVLNDGGSHNMTVNAFTCTYGSGGSITSTLNGSGADAFGVGATIAVAAAQAAGVYTNSSDLTVLVNYN